MSQKYSILEYQDHSRFLEMCKIEFQKNYLNPPTGTKTPEDFDVIKAIGNGAFGEVFLVRDKTSFQYFAMKVVEKDVVYQRKQIKSVVLEKKIMQALSFTFLLSISCTFKDNVYLYFVLPYMAGGEMFTYIQKYGYFNEELTKFYTCQLILAIEYLHYCHVIHRDLKPENVLVETTGYLKLCDFGFCKVVNKKTYSLCGTPEYIAPEIILSKGYSYSVDWWAMGVLIYEMSVGMPPFFSSEPTKLYEKILDCNYKCPSQMSSDSKALVKGFLQVDPKKRLGTMTDGNGVYDIKSHSWFNDINWQQILNRNVQPPLIPECSSAGDTSNFPECRQAILKKSSKCLLEEYFEDF